MILGYIPVHYLSPLPVPRGSYCIKFLFCSTSVYFLLFFRTFSSSASFSLSPFWVIFFSILLSISVLIAHSRIWVPLFGCVFRFSYIFISIKFIHVRCSPFSLHLIFLYSSLTWPHIAKNGFVILPLFKVRFSKSVFPLLLPFRVFFLIEGK